MPTWWAETWLHDMALFAGPEEGKYVVRLESISTRQEEMGRHSDGSNQGPEQTVDLKKRTI